MTVGIIIMAKQTWHECVGHVRESKSLIAVTINIANGLRASTRSLLSMIELDNLWLFFMPDLITLPHLVHKLT